MITSKSTGLPVALFLNLPKNTISLCHSIQAVTNKQEMRKTCLQNLSKSNLCQLLMVIESVTFYMQYHITSN